jgi:hypothetical protein
MSQQISNGLSGLVLAGSLVGYKEEERKGNDGQPWKQLFVGIEIPVTNGYKGETKVIDVQVPDRLQNAQLFDLINKLINKPVLVKAYVRAFPTRAGAGYGFNLDVGDNALEESIMPQNQLLAVKAA